MATPQAVVNTSLLGVSPRWDVVRVSQAMVNMSQLSAPLRWDVVEFRLVGLSQVVVNRSFVSLRLFKAIGRD